MEKFKSVEKMLKGLAWKNIKSLRMEFDDIFQELCLEYILVAKKFDVSKNTKFSTFIHTCMVNRLNVLRSRKDTQKQHKIIDVDFTLSVLSRIPENEIFFYRELEKTHEAKYLFTMMQKGIFNRPESKTHNKKLSVDHIKKTLTNIYFWTKQEIETAFSDLNTCYKTAYAI